MSLSRQRILGAVSLTLVLITILALGACAPQSSASIKVVTSTSLLAYIAEQVGGNRLEVVNLVPPAQHPGDFSTRPGDIQTLSDARLLLLHGWPGEGYADKLVTAANNPDLVVIKASVNGTWMVPSVQMAATDKVANILSEIDAEGASAYKKAAEDYKKRVQAKEVDLKARLAKANVSQVNVITSDRQADFLKWAGLNVVAIYVPDSLSIPQVVKELADKGKAAGVTLVVDNLQSGKDAGKGLAEELGAKNISLSNFPGGLENTETWEKAIERNVDLILKAIAN